MSTSRYILKKEKTRNMIKSKSYEKGLGISTMYICAHGLQTPNEGINQRNLKFFGRYGRQNILRQYLKICDWDLIFGRAVKAFSSLGVRSPCMCSMIIKPDDYITYFFVRTYYSVHAVGFILLRPLKMTVTVSI